MLSQLRSKPSIAIILTILCLLCIGTFLGADDGVATTVVLQEPKLTESSGLAFSHRDPNCVWTHNDSGDSARLFCFDHKTGKRTGSCVLKDAKAIDWEEMTIIAPAASNPLSDATDFGDASKASNDDTETAQIIVADSGNNNGRRASVVLYQFAEPDPHADSKLTGKQWSRTIIQFEGGPVDCEAIWFEPSSQQVMFLAKTVAPYAGVYGVRLNEASTDTQIETRPVVQLETQTKTSDQAVVVAKRLTTLPVPGATGADRDWRTGEIIVVNYWQTFRFAHQPGDDLLSQLSRTPESTKLPKWRQIEAIAWDRDSQVWITTEGSPALLGKLRK